jgi:hypothetical protein
MNAKILAKKSPTVNDLKWRTASTDTEPMKSMAFSSLNMSWKSALNLSLPIETICTPTRQNSTSGVDNTFTLPAMGIKAKMHEYSGQNEKSTNTHHQIKISAFYPWISYTCLDTEDTRKRRKEK